MGAIIIRILLLAFFAWLIRSVLMSIQGLGKARPKKAKTEEAGVMVRDPVCGMYLDSRLTIRIDKQGKPVYFCSENCKSKYLSESADKVSGE